MFSAQTEIKTHIPVKTTFQGRTKLHCAHAERLLGVKARHMTLRHFEELQTVQAHLPSSSAFANDQSAFDLPLRFVLFSYDTRS